MPLSHFPARSWDPASPEVEKWLAQAAVAEQAVIGSASNYVFLLELESPSDAAGSGYAIYKPERGETPLWDFPPALYKREIAAYRVSEALGWRLVPPTIEREERMPHGVGSVQLYIAADHRCTYFDLRDAHADTMRRFAVFDWLTNNADRKGGHVLIDARDHIWGIDNGLTFNVDEKLRTVIWDFVGEPVPSDLLEDVDAFAGGLDLDSDLWRELAVWLTLTELRQLHARARAIVERAHFPEPREGSRPYPWPII